MVYVKICLTNWVAINLKTHLWGSKSDQFCQFWRLKKVDGSRFFWSIFDFIDPKSELYGFIEKQAPQKALCLGPDPPPWRKVEIYRKFMIFIDFGAFNRAGKSVSKIGIYALPPLKSEFYANF
jgi:hypothetical protein